MKHQSVLVASLLATSPFVYAADGHNHAPKHGGIVTEIKEAEYELVARADLIQLYVRADHKAIDTSRATARLTLLSGSDKQEIELTPVEGKFEAKGQLQSSKG